MERLGMIDGDIVRFIYDPEQDGGTITLHYSQSQKTIRDQDVLAAIEKPRTGIKDDGDQHHHVLLAFTVDPLSALYRLESYHAVNLPERFTRIHSAPAYPDHLNILPYQDGSSNLHVVVSVGSGRGEAQKFYDEVLKMLLLCVELDETSYRLHLTESEDSIIDFTRTVLLPRAKEGFSQTVLLLSGDGGVFDVINVLLSAMQTDSYVKPIVCLLALGSGNALAHSTGIIHGSDRGLRNLLRGKPHSLPTFTASFSAGSEFMVDAGRSRKPLPISEAGHGLVHGAVVCSWALHASLVADSDTPEYRKYGNDRFLMAAKELLSPADGSSSHIYKGRITFPNNDSDKGHITEGEEFREHSYLLASLVSNLEEKFMVSPHSKPLDGQLRLIRIGPAPSSELSELLKLAFQGGRHIESTAVYYVEFRQLRIDFEEEDIRWRRVCVDGKIITVNAGGWVELKRQERDVLSIIVDMEARP
jgi:diacylglycerol kinase family enzyme